VVTVLGAIKSAPPRGEVSETDLPARGFDEPSSKVSVIVAVDALSAGSVFWLVIRVDWFAIGELTELRFRTPVH